MSHMRVQTTKTDKTMTTGLTTNYDAEKNTSDIFKCEADSR